MTKLQKICVSACILVLLLIFAFFDLQISNAIYSPNNGFGKFFEVFGELPGALIAVFCAAAMIATRNTQVKWKSITNIVGFGILLCLFSYMAAFMPLNYLGGFSPIVPVLAVIYFIVALLLAFKLSQNQKENLRQAAIIGILTFVAVILIINLVKMEWGRMRFRSITDPIAQFSAWYLPQGFTTDNEFMSFPSGHSANSTVILWILLIPTFIPKLENKKIILKVVAFAWIIMVMISRVIMGAHFASDVLMGATISVLTFYIIKVLVKDKHTKVQRNKTLPNNCVVDAK